MGATPNLTSNAIQRMSGSEIVNEPIILQVGCFLRMQHRGLPSTAVMVSDGVHITKAFLVNKWPTEMMLVEKLSIIKVKHYYRSVIEKADGCRKVLFEIDDMTILRLGSAIQHFIGYPEPFHNSLIMKEDVILRTKCLAEKAPLTKNALRRIMAGEIVERPAVQILSAKLRSCAQGKARMVLGVCDGLKVEHVLCSQPLILQLKHHLRNLKMSIIQLDKYVLANGCIVVGEMTWLNWGSHVCFTRGLLSHRANLSTGCIQEYFRHGRLVRDPIVQIVKIKTVQIQGEPKERKRLLLYDGKLHNTAYLSTQLEQSMTGSLIERSGVRLDVYKMNPVFLNGKHNFRSITICGLTLVNGAYTTDFQGSYTPVSPKLTHGVIKSRFNNMDLIKPVVRIVKVNYILNGSTHQNYIRLLIYDGTRTCHAYLPSYMNYLLDYLEKLPIVRLDSCFPPYENDYAVHRLTIFSMTALYRDENENYTPHPSDESYA